MQGLWPAPTEAEARFRTLELTATLSVDSVAFRGIMEREVEEHRRRHGPRSAAIITSFRSRSEDESDDRWSRQSWHVWWMPPTHWREEVGLSGFPPIVIVVRPDVSLSWSPMRNTLHTTEPAQPVTGLPDRLRRLVRRIRDRKHPFDSMRLETIPDR